MERGYRHILPIPSPTEADETATALHPRTVKRKRSVTVMACNGCRIKKSACDGIRPACTPCAKRAAICTYMSSTSESPATVKKREIEALREDHRKLTDFIHILRTTQEPEVTDIIRTLQRTTANPDYFLPSNTGGLFKALPLPYTSTPCQGSIEFELMIRHAIAYPTLAPLDMAARWIASQPASAQVNNFTAATSSDTSAVANLSCLGTEHQNLTDIQYIQSQSKTPEEGSSTVYCDPRLNLLNISSWSRVAITNSLAATLISLYLKTDHPTLGFFDANLFLTDLIDCRVRYCSHLLVSSILSWACLAYRSFEPQVTSVGLAFFAEANKLWQLEQTSDSLPAVAAAQLLSLVAIYNGDDGYFRYFELGTQMAQRMSLLGLPALGLVDLAGQGLELDELIRARSHTAWGVFNWIVMRSILFQEEEAAAKYPPSSDPPSSDPPDTHPDSSPEELTADTPEMRSSPAYMGRTFPAMCEFWTYTCEWTVVYYKSNGTPVHDRVSFEFAHKMFQKLLSWSDKLNAMLARGEKSSHHCIILHIWLHASVLQLFRPFVQHTIRPFVQRINKKQSDFSKAVFTASLNQLKHLAILFRQRYTCAPYAAFWHIALLHIGNAVVQDTKDPQWRAYFKLCVDSYADLHGAFRIAGGIVKSLLSVALRLKAINGCEARDLMIEFSDKDNGHANTEKMTVSLVVDLDLAGTDRVAAQLVSLDNSFDDLVLFGDFTDMELATTPRKSAVTTK